MARSTRSTIVATLGAALVLAVPAAAMAAPTAVDVRIEGQTSTIYESPITSDGKTITTALGGTHVCDGPSATSGPTPTTALDDAAIKGGFTWDGSYFDPPGDFFAERIAGETQDLTNFYFWSVFVNGAMLDVGGCQHIVSAGDEVLWAYDAFNKTGGALTLKGPDATQPGVPITVEVTNTATHAPVAAVPVGTATTDGTGKAAISFATPGIYRIKADRPDYVRSRALTVCVDPPGAEACTSGDQTAPTVRLDAPAVSSTLGRFSSIHLSWQGDDGPSGSGIRRYRVESRRLDVPGSSFSSVVTDTPATAREVAGTPGAAYQFRVTAFDRASRASTPATATSLVPLDNLSNRVKFAKGGWKTLKRQGGYQLSVARSKKAGATARVSFTGSGATLVTRKLPFGGNLRMTVDGKSQLVRLRGKGGFRTVVTGTRRLKAGKHTLTLESVSDKPVEIDAIAIRP